MSTHARLQRQRRFRSTAIALMAVPLMAGVAGCESPDQGLEITEAAATASSNGLVDVNGLRTVNGLRSVNGLRTVNGLSGELAPSSQMMSTPEGRRLAAYVVKCALPAGRSLIKKDAAGVSYTFTGLVGIAPEWERNSCGQTCQEWMTACLLSLVNTTGTHVPILMMAERSGIGFGQNPAYPRQEGSFFGNIFSSDPKAYFCAGRDFNVSPVPGRIGSSQTDPPYVNRYGSGGRCSSNCRSADGASRNDGYTSCSTWDRVVTIWRQ